MNGPPSSGHVVIAGSRSSRTSLVTTSVTGPPEPRFRPTLSRSRPTSRAAPQLRRRRRQDRLGEVNQPVDQTKRPLAERELGASRRSEQIRDEREVRIRDVAKHERRTVGRDHAAMNLRRLLRRIDRGIDEDDVVVATERSRKVRRSGNDTANGICTSREWPVRAESVPDAGARRPDRKARRVSLLDTSERLSNAARRDAPPRRRW